MDFEQRVQEYRQSAETQSPIWIWFKANGETLSCLICKTNLPRTSSSTTNYISHLKRHHGHFKKYNASSPHRIAWYRGDIFNYRIASELADIEKNLTRVLSQPHDLYRNALALTHVKKNP